METVRVSRPQTVPIPTHVLSTLCRCIFNLRESDPRKVPRHLLCRDVSLIGPVDIFDRLRGQILFFDLLRLELGFGGRSCNATFPEDCRLKSEFGDRYLFPEKYLSPTPRKAGPLRRLAQLVNFAESGWQSTTAKRSESSSFMHIRFIVEAYRCKM